MQEQEKEFKIARNLENFDVLRQNGFEIEFDFGNEEEKEVLSVSVKTFCMSMPDKAIIRFTGFVGLPEVLYRLGEQDKITFTYSLHTSDYKKRINFKYVAEPESVSVYNDADDSSELMFKMVLKNLQRCSL